MLSNIGATPEQVQALVDEGMLEEVEEGWLIHDYAEHNRTKEQVLHARADAKERKSKSRCHSTVTAVSQRDMRVTSGQTPEHQNTRTPKKEKEEYSSSFSKETGVTEFGDSWDCREVANKTIAVEYPNLDLESAWFAFAGRHQDETRAIGDWTRLWKGWCQRRANMSGIPPSKRHIHTWQCEHVLQALGRDKETATPDQRACQMAKRLNKEKS